MIKIANAPCSWGVLEFGLEGKTAGYAQVLNEMGETGYAGTELGDWGFMPTEPERLREELSRRGLSLVGAFVPVALSDESKYAEGESIARKTAQQLARVGGPSAIVVLADDNGKDPVRTKNAGRIRPEQGLSAEQWRAFATATERIATLVGQETGLRVAFHHHAAGYVETPAEIEQLLELTDPAKVGLCFDTGHYRLGGGDPVEGLKKYYDRVWHVHFKDFSPQVSRQARANQWDYFESVRRGIFPELGKGEVDFGAIAATLKERGYNGWTVVEQDVVPGLGTPKASAQRNREYLRGIGL